MGLYDRIVCEYPLPEGLEKYQNQVFQTKDLGNTFTTYTITRDGRLVERREYYGDHPTKTKWNPILERDVPISVLAHQAVIDQSYHGDIVFYHYWIGTFAHHDREAIELKARFTRGVLDWIREEERPTA